MNVLLLANGNSLGSLFFRLNKVGEHGHNVTDLILRDIRDSKDAFERAIYEVDHSVDDPKSVDVIINAFSYHGFKDQDVDSEIESIQVNGIFPRVLLKMFPNAKLIQVNSTHLFEGIDSAEIPNEGSPNRVGSIKTKSRALSNIENDRVINLHVEYLKIQNDYQKQDSLLPWVLSLPDNSSIAGFVDHWWNGITDVALCKLILALLGDLSTLDHGTYFISSKRPVTRYQLLNYISWAYKKNLDINRAPSLQKKSECVNTSHTLAIKNLWIKAGYGEIPDIRTLLEEQKVVRSV